MSKTMMVYQVEKDEVQKMDLFKVKKFFREIEKLKENACQCVVLIFDGYDDVLDELFEIPEVRKWVKALVKEIPHIWYFLNVEAETLQLVLTCISDNFESIVQGEMLTGDEYMKRGMLPPQRITDLQIPNATLMKMVRSIQKYGEKIDDKTGTIAVLMAFDQIFHILD